MSLDDAVEAAKENPDAFDALPETVKAFLREEAKARTDAALRKLARVGLAVMDHVVYDVRAANALTPEELALARAELAREDVTP